MNVSRRDAVKSMILGTVAVAGGLARGQTPPATTPGQLFTLPDLAYPFEALEPHIDAMTMSIHHDKHHAAYVNNLNKALEGHADLASKSIDDLVRGLQSVPEAIRTAVRNNGGGHANHSLFWKCLSPDGGGQPEGALADAITATFGDFAQFKDKLTGAAKGVFGSGWAWLSMTPDRKLIVESTPNQDSPLTAGNTPLLGIDVWEHAYYLKYHNRRPAYLEAIFNVIHWQFVTARFIELETA